MLLSMLMLMLILLDVDGGGRTEVDKSFGPFRMTGARRMMVPVATQGAQYGLGIWLKL